MHSPLLGPLTWQPVAAELRRRGHDAEAPAWARLSAVEGDHYRALACGLSEALGERPGVVVAHSGAGALMPALAAASDAVRAVVFADAILPHPGRSWFDTAPPDLAASLRAGARFGVLPSWDAWWPPGALERLLPDPDLRAALVDELDGLPLGYFEETAPTVPLASPAAYLQLSGAYDEEARLAGLRGWPVVRLPLNHLAMLTEVAAVASALEGLITRLESANG